MAKRFKKKHSPWKSFFSSFVITFLSLAIVVIFLLYGPWSGFRQLWITTAMTTMNHKYLATMFYTEDVINEVLANNIVIESGQSTNSGEITINNNGKPTIKKHIVKGTGYYGYMLEISNPSWIHIGISNKFGSFGEKLVDIVEDYNAIAAINASGFVDPGGHGKGGTPVGIIVQDGKVIYKGTSKVHDIIGFNEEGVLVLGKFTEKQIKEQGIVNGIDFGPFLIVNGESATIKGDGGWGIAPRTAIGQRKDGTVLFLVIDGRQPGYSIGIKMSQVQKIMEDFGAYNAANVDGGSSSSMHLNGELITKPCGPSGERWLPNAFVICSPSDYKAAQAKRTHLID
ncbi:MAG: phosphodiester glycosidase family protein [Clostridia bacterium]|nr:phosphodiester glycosidase family protein [Clostridia bacterium]